MRNLIVPARWSIFFESYTLLVRSAKLLCHCRLNRFEMINEIFIRKWQRLLITYPRKILPRDKRFKVIWKSFEKNSQIAMLGKTCRFTLSIGVSNYFEPRTSNALFSRQFSKGIRVFCHFCLIIFLYHQWILFSMLFVGELNRMVFEIVCSVKDWE